MIKIPLGQNKFALIDDCDIDLLWNYSWVLANYARARVNGKLKLLHIVIAERMWQIMPEEVDHIDRDKLNCQRNNLRKSTRSTNQHNKIYKTSKLFRGVSFESRLKKYRARISTKNGRVHLGLFETAEEAARVHDKAALAEFKDFAVLNFPIEIEVK